MPLRPDRDRRILARELPESEQEVVPDADAPVREGRASRSSRFVPWIATGPPCAQCVSVGEKAEMPIAAGPNGPAESGATSFWST
jgi:hypothetical protein